MARTVIAPVERVKIIYQINSKSTDQGWLRIIKKVLDESGGGLRSVTDFWKGNSVAVLRVFPYLGVQMASNELFRRQLKSGPVPFSPEARASAIFRAHVHLIFRCRSSWQEEKCVEIRWFWTLFERSSTRRRRPHGRCLHLSAGPGAGADGPGSDLELQPGVSSLRVLSMFITRIVSAAE